MEFKILSHSYENTGGGCMVGFASVWLPEENRVIFVQTNDEGSSFWTVDAYHAGLDTLKPFDYLTTTYTSAVTHKYFEVARECMRRFLRCDGRHSLPYVWLPDQVKEQVTEDYTKWLYEEHGVSYPFYFADETKLYMEEEYEDLIREQNRKRAAEEAAAIVADLNRAEIVVAFENFKRAYADVVSVWSKERELVSNILVEDYPFDQSFDELGVPQWCDDVIRGVLLEGRK